MPQFDVHRNLDAATNGHSPYVIDLQTNLLVHLGTRVVVPLVHRRDFGTPAPRLNPVFQVEGMTVVMSTGELGGLFRRELGEVVMSLSGARDEIVAALDYLFTGV